jgi:ATP/maltotriose-dependent transcriptional regulator MalT
MRQQITTRPDLAGNLARGRESYKRRAWADAYSALTLADEIVPLGAADLELLAMCAYLIAQDEEYLCTLDRAYHAHLSASEGPQAARCAFWLALRFLFRGETGRATGWLARARRLIECEERECVESGYLLLPIAEGHLDTAESEIAFAVGCDAAEIGKRFCDADLIAVARHLQGRARIQQGRVAEGLSLLDEAMLAVTSGELSALVTGLIYCSVIDSCRQVFAIERAREWTTALARWCAEQPEMVSFTGRCLVHRAEILQLHGAWQDALIEARRGCERFEKGIDPQRPALACYQLAELHRLRGDFAAAEQAYRCASSYGMEPQPGLALLRLAQGRLQTAVRAIRRVVAATTDLLELARLLPANVEILLHVSEIDEARSACRHLEEIAKRFDTPLLGALAHQARGALNLAEGDAQAALCSLRTALQVWQRMEAPYMVARTRLQIALACRALADADGADLELRAARIGLEQLGAAPDLARVESYINDASPGDGNCLTAREKQVLRLVATGKTNKGIAGELRVSERTVDRHVSNIFNKLTLRSRAAATAYAYQHSLI